MHQPVESNYDIRFVRLSSGEDLISEVVEMKKDDDIYYVLRNPLKILYLSSAKTASSLSISLMQWVFHRICEDQDFMIYPTDVVTMGNPTSSMLEYYLNSVEHFESIKEEHKKSIEFDQQKKRYIQSSIEEDITDEGEGIDMLKEFLDRIKKTKGPDGGTLH